MRDRESERFSEQWLHPRGLFAILAGGVLILLIGAVAAVVYATGGTAFVWPHLMYVPLVLASFIFGLPGGIITGLVGGLLLGPLMPLHVASNAPQTTTAWLFRSGFFILLGGLSGFLFDRLKHYLHLVKNSARLDGPSGLPNVLALHEILHQAHCRKDVPTSPYLLAIVDFVNADEIMHSIGFQTARNTLPQILERLTSPVLENISLFRISLYRFALLARGIELGRFIRTGREVIKQFEKPVYAGDIPIALDLRIGVVEPHMVSSADELIQKAISAAHQATVDGTAIAVYDRNRDKSSIETLALLGSLNNALSNHQLEIHYQPKVNIATNRAVSAEALIRWIHPEEGMVPPDRYISQAEKTWLVHPLTRFTMESTLKQLKAWLAQGLNLKIAVNFTARNLQESEFMDDIIRLIRQYDIPASNLEVEITERTVVTQYNAVSQAIKKLRDMGVTISIDDFGTGYSTLELLTRFPFDSIKFDQKYIRTLATSPTSLAIVRRLIQVTKDLKIKTIAEGVDSAETYEKLVELGCDFAQGYHLSPPLPPDEFSTWIKRYNKNR